MPSLLLPDLDDDLAERLRARAEAHGRSVEAEARDLLRGALGGGTAAARGPTHDAASEDDDASEGLGTLAARIFAGVGLTKEEYEIFRRGTEAHRHETPRGADFGE